MQVLLAPPGEAGRGPRCEYHASLRAAAEAAISQAAGSMAKAGAPELLQALNQQSLDGSKGVSMQFRPWDGQLQQTLLLTDGQGVISTAPVEGVLHPRNVLDTLGADSSEKRCPARL